MTLLVTKGVGVEEILDAVEIVLQNDMNDALTEIFERREPLDMARAERRGLLDGYTPLTFDPVPADHYHQGNFPSFVLEEVPKDDYPYVVLTVEDFAPDPEDARHDHITVMRDALVIHTLAKAEPEEGSDAVFRRAVRMGEAVFLCLASDPQMAHMLSGISNPVRGQHSIPWTHQFKGRGKDHWFQSVGTTYAIKSYTTTHD